MTKHEFKRWLTPRHTPVMVEFEQLFLGNRPDPLDIRKFFMRTFTANADDLYSLCGAPSSSRLLDEDMTRTYDESLWHIIHGILIRNHQAPYRHLDHLFWACHVPESIMARTHVALVKLTSEPLLRFIKYGERPEQYIESLSSRIRHELCQRKIHGWEDVQWSLPLDVTSLQKTIEPGLLRAIDDDDVATFAILKTFTRKNGSPWSLLPLPVMLDISWRKRRNAFESPLPEYPSAPFCSPPVPILTTSRAAC